MKVVGKCSKCGKDLKVAYDGKAMYFVKCTNKKCDFKDDFKSDDKQKVIDNWSNKEGE